MCGYGRMLLAFLLFAAPAWAQTPTIPDRGNTPFDAVKKGTAKIVGGIVAPPGTYPWQVSLQRSDYSPPRGHFCGASIRNERWLVTAAHCMVGLQPTDFGIVVGVQTFTSTTERHKVERIIINKQYDRNSQDYDVALVMLSQPLAIGPNVQAIAPLSGTEEAALGNSELFVTGWGVTQQGGSTVLTLREVAVPLISTKECNDPLAYNGGVTERMLCAGLAQGGKDSCQGDSGGPLATARTGTAARLVGVVSWGEGCAKPGKPGVYSRVSQLTGWIESCIQSPNNCQ